jgi:hypothetical protein
MQLRDLVNEIMPGLSVSWLDGITELHSAEVLTNSVGVR